MVRQEDNIQGIGFNEWPGRYMEIFTEEELAIDSSVLPR
jgi:hypothetical protein